MKTYDWDTQLRLGRESEQMLLSVFRAQGDVVREVQSRYVDFVVEIEGRQWRCDVKRDEKSDETGNLAVEVESVVEAGVPGWGVASHETDVYLYHAPVSGAVYVVPGIALRQSMKMIQERYPRRVTSTRQGWTTAVCTPGIPWLAFHGIILRTWRPEYGRLRLT